MGAGGGRARESGAGAARVGLGAPGKWGERRSASGGAGAVAMPRATEPPHPEQSCVHSDTSAQGDPPPASAPFLSPPRRPRRAARRWCCALCGPTRACASASSRSSSTSPPLTWSGCSSTSSWTGAWTAASTRWAGAAGWYCRVLPGTAGHRRVLLCTSRWRASAGGLPGSGWLLQESQRRRPRPAAAAV